MISKGIGPEGEPIATQTEPARSQEVEGGSRILKINTPDSDKNLTAARESLADLSRREQDLTQKIQAKAGEIARSIDGGNPAARDEKKDEASVEQTTPPIDKDSQITHGSLFDQEDEERGDEKAEAITPAATVEIRESETIQSPEEDLAEFREALKRVKEQKVATEMQIMDMEAEEQVLLAKMEAAEKVKSEAIAGVRREIFSTAGKLGNLEKKIRRPVTDVEYTANLFEFADRCEAATNDLVQQKAELAAQLAAKQEELKSVKEGEHPTLEIVNKYTEDIKNNLEALRNGTGQERVTGLLAELMEEAGEDTKRQEQLAIIEATIDAECRVLEGNQAKERKGFLGRVFGKLIETATDWKKPAKKIGIALGASVALIGGFGSIMGGGPNGVQNTEAYKQTAEAPPGKAQVTEEEVKVNLPPGVSLEKTWGNKTDAREAGTPVDRADIDVPQPESAAGVDVSQPEVAAESTEIAGAEQVDTGSTAKETENKPIMDRTLDEWAGLVGDSYNEQQVKQLIGDPALAGHFQAVVETFREGKGIDETTDKSAVRVFLANRIPKAAPATAGENTSFDAANTPVDKPEVNKTAEPTKSAEAQDTYFAKPGGHDKLWWQNLAAQTGKWNEFQKGWGDKNFRANLDRISATNLDSAEKARAAGQKEMTFSNGEKDPHKDALQQAVVLGGNEINGAKV